MPIYEYRCQACGHTLEALQKMSEEPLIECPSCGKPALQKLVSASGFQLKGTGWYETDFKNNHKKPETSKDAAATSATPAATETKPASSTSSEKDSK